MRASSAVGRLSEENTNNSTTNHAFHDPQRCMYARRRARNMTTTKTKELVLFATVLASYLDRRVHLATTVHSQCDITTTRTRSICDSHAWLVSIQVEIVTLATTPGR